MLSAEISLEIFLRLLFSLALGALIGFEREYKRRPAGLRTHMLVSLGACLFTVVSFYSFHMDPARIAAGIVTGVGFLGAGVIIGSGTHIKGVTTAATIWVVAGVGLTVGIGEYLIALMTTFLVLLILIIKPTERKMIQEFHKKKVLE